MHEEAIEQYGGESGLYDYTDDKIDSILDQQFSHFGYDKYPTLFDKTAMLGYFFAKDHCFRDGNKRVGLYVIDVMLAVNNHQLTLTNQEAEAMMNKIAESNVRGIEVDNYIKSISTYIEEHSIELA